MLKVAKDNKQIMVETGGAIFAWDLTRGAQIVRCDVKSGERARPIIPKGAMAGNMTFDLAGQTVSLADEPVAVTYGREDQQCFIFKTKARLAGIFTIEQQFEVFRENERLIWLNGKRIRARDTDPIVDHVPDRGL